MRNLCRRKKKHSNKHETNQTCCVLSVDRTVRTVYWLQGGKESRNKFALIISGKMVKNRNESHGKYVNCFIIETKTLEKMLLCQVVICVHQMFESSIPSNSLQFWCQTSFIAASQMNIINIVASFKWHQKPTYAVDFRNGLEILLRMLLPGFLFHEKFSNSLNGLLSMPQWESMTNDMIFPCDFSHLNSIQRSISRIA